MSEVAQELGTLLAILKEANLLVGALRDMGVTIHGTIDLATLLALVKR